MKPLRPGKEIARCQIATRWPQLNPFWAEDTDENSDGLRQLEILKEGEFKWHFEDLVGFDGAICSASETLFMWTLGHLNWNDNKLISSPRMMDPKKQSFNEFLTQAMMSYRW